MLADFAPQRFGGQEERSGKPVRDPLRVQLGGNGKHDVAACW